MNILLVIPSLDVGGAQTFLIRLAPELKRTGHNVYVYEIHPSQRNLAFYQKLTVNVKVFSSLYENLEGWFKLKKLSWGVRALKSFNSRFKLREIIERWQLLKICKEKDIQLVNSHMFLADLFVIRLLGDQKKLRFVSSFHGCYSLIQDQLAIEERGDAVKAFMEQIHIIFGKMQGIVYVTQHQLNFPESAGVSHIKQEKIYYGYIPEKEDSKLKTELVEKNDFVVGMVARGDQTKGWEELILAFRKVQDKYEAFNGKLLLIGGGAFMEKLKVKYRSSNVHFIGAVTSPMEYIEQFNVAALPTYFPAESLPNSVIEYLYAGKPVIATNVAEIPLMLKNEEGETGGVVTLLTDDGKADVLQLTAALEKYYLAPQLLKEHSIIAKEAFQKFEMKTCINKYLQFYEEVIDQ